MDAGDILGALSALGATSFAGEAWRHAAPQYEPTSGAGARSHGGRWNPPNSFDTLYLALDRATAAREFRRMAEKAGLPLEGFLPRRLHRYRVDVRNLVDLRSEAALADVGLTLARVQADDPTHCRAVGAAAHQLGSEGILAPSATGIGEVLVIFGDRLGPDSRIDPIDFTDWDGPPELL